jgi:hypothetical protein
MSHLAMIDDLLDLISDVKAIDRLVYSAPADGLIAVQLWCENELHSEVLMSTADFGQAQMILTGALTIEAAK